MAVKTYLNNARKISLLMVILTFSTIAHAKIIYVDDDAVGANDGSSWTDAYNHLQDALTAANYGDEIRVAQGTYKPDKGAGQTPGDRNAKFRLINGLTLKGGFAGIGELDPDARDISLYETVLSGDLNGDDDTVGMNDNSRCILFGPDDVDNITVLEGLIITAGFAGNDCPDGRGAGLWTYAGSPKIVSCSFTKNYVLGDNSAGAGIGTYRGSLVVSNCTFRENHAEGRNAYGAGIWNHEGASVVTDCRFSQNTAVGYSSGGAGIGTYSGGLVVSNSIFLNNHVEGSYAQGAGLASYEGTSVVTACEFSENTTLGDSSGGAGLFSYEGNITVIDCSFVDNIASGRASSAAGMDNYSGDSTITRCTFIGNHGSRYGGGLSTYNGSPAVTCCTFIGNSAEYGAGFWSFEGSPVFSCCTFIDNNSLRLGGAIYNLRGSPAMRNCLFAENSSEDGAAFWTYYGMPNIVNCTFASNTASQRGGGIWSYEATLNIINSILWKNIDETGDAVQAQIFSQLGEPLISHSWIAKDPLFLDPENGDYHLNDDSPCINTGDPNYVSEPDEKDLDGKPRVIGCRIDMGVFEYRHVVPAVVRIVPHNINLTNKGKGFTAYLWPHEGYNISETEFCILFLEDEIQPEQLLVNEKEQVIVAKFNHEQIQDILNIGLIELKISAQLTDANCLEGTDQIKVVYEGGGKSNKLGKAGDPNPPDGATNVNITPYLRWTPGSNAISHDVYFGTTSPPPFVRNQTAAIFNPGTLAYGTTYFWQINEVNNSGTTKGQLWSFTTVPVPPPPPPPP